MKEDSQKTHEKIQSKSNKIKNIVYHEISLVITAVIVISLIVGGIVYLNLHASRVYIEKAEIEAPTISLKPDAPGILEKTFVKEGDFVSINAVVAQVGNNTIRTRTSGIITSIKNTPGQFVTSQDVIATMINPDEFRVVGHIEENKGLEKLKPGQKVLFTVDTYGSKEYEGVVDLVSPTSRESDVVFSISDKREEKIFDVKATFDYQAYPEIKNGMSARMWVYTE